MSCGAVASCMAVGDFIGDGNEFSLAEVWNGTTWTKLKTPVHP